MITVNSIEIRFGQFPNGETNIITDFELLKAPSSEIVFKYENDSDLIKLMLVKKHLDHVNARRYDCIDSARLIISYMPYSRQDRSEGGSVFTLKHVAEFINSLNFRTVTVLEPHSDVTPALLNKCITEYPTTTLLKKAIEEIGFDIEKDYIFYPDAGAQKRYSSKNPGFKEIVGFKKRDFKSGKIESLQVVGAKNVCDSKIIIVDDLCSRGGTFIMSAKKLKEIGAAEIYLVVTHCEETILQGEILITNLIQKVFTTDSIINDPHLSKIKVFRSDEI
jgi:ribose-phosphate pyrophosphokinase